eukprot:CAMPEP_0172313276 /NCGR_PEP_ID=MMETSP1058-20130122/19903_1 /TAXON_ID=83371 /ORGANISM="Detonula confervacea, Strain CCMP 353" /LENGTH=323 /DNA_ID=CAMNT_0013026905 /DNA_START=46 /DNA_END=1017 /DNA_ORIENTATION=+
MGSAARRIRTILALQQSSSHHTTATTRRTSYSSSIMIMHNSILLTLLATTILLLAISNNDKFLFANAFAPPPLILATPPILGIGAVLFRPRNTKILKSDGDGDALVKAGKFFVDAFWTGKIGGADSLSSTQSSSLERQQIAEFKKRYNAKRSTAGAAASVAAKGSNRLPGNYATQSASLDSRAELVLCVDGKGECIGCAGVEVDKIKIMDGYDTTITGPIMSNLAISRKYRRKGLAEDLVKSTELIARKEWGYDTCYLYVEKRNTPAIKLYKKLGYKTIWEDDDATTLLPTKDGRVMNGKTTIVCMKKKLGGGLFGSWFGGGV